MAYLPSEGSLTALESVNKALENLSLTVDVISDAGENVARKELSGQQDGNPGGHDSGYASKESSNAPSPAVQHKKAFPVPDSQIGHVKQGLFKKKLRRYDRNFSDREHKRFADLKILLGRTLSEHLQGKRVTFSGAIQLKLLVMGEEQASARLFIVVACPRHLVKTVRQFFKQKMIINELQPVDPLEVKFEVAVREQVQLLSNNGSILVWPRNVASCEDFSKLKYVNGLPIAALVNGQRVMATLGGLITITYPNGACETYGLTAGHAFRNGRIGKVGSHDTELEIFDVCQQKEGQPTSPFSQASADIAIPSLGDDAVFTVHDDDYEIESLDTFADLTEDIFLETTINDNTPPIGMIDESLTASATDDDHPILYENRDWALIRPHHETFSLPVEWAKNVSKSRYDLRLSTDRNVLSMNQTREVHIARPTGIDEKGFLSRTESSVMISPANSFIDIYTLGLCPPTELQTGDSGAWVYDATSREVYGHIVGRGLFGEGLVMPMYAILADIRKRLGAIDIRVHKGPITAIQSESLVETLGSLPLSTFIPWPEQRLSFSDSGYASMDSSPTPLPKIEETNPDSGYASLDSSPQSSPPRPMSDLTALFTPHVYVSTKNVPGVSPLTTAEVKATETSRKRKRKRDRLLTFIKFGRR